MLEKTSLYNSLSDLGRRVETPNGIFYWSARAKTEAQIDGTIGIAQDDDGTISHLPIAEEWSGPKVNERLPKGRIFAYAAIPGVESLRKKWLGRMLSGSPELMNYATLPVVTNGITHSIAIASRMFLNPGDTVITADKSWENYEHIFVTMQGVKIATFALFNKEGRFDPTSFIEVCKQQAQEKGKVVALLNFPHNQTGFMPTAADAAALGSQLQALVKSNPTVPFVIILDDAYEAYVYDSGENAGLKGSILPHVFFQAPNYTVVKLDGISKVMLAYGYRIGFITFFVNSLSGAEFTVEEFAAVQKEMTSKAGGLVRGEISQANHHGQILADALMDQIQEVEAQRGKVIAMLGARWKKMMETFEANYTKYGRERLWMDPCNGGFFGYINLKPGIDSKTVAERLLTEKKIGVVPSAGGLRVAFAGVAESKIEQMVNGIFEVVYT